MNPVQSRTPNRDPPPCPALLLPRAVAVWALAWKGAVGTAVTLLPLTKIMVFPPQAIWAHPGKRANLAGLSREWTRRPITTSHRPSLRVSWTCRNCSTRRRRPWLDYLVVLTMTFFNLRTPFRLRVRSPMVSWTLSCWSTTRPVRLRSTIITVPITLCGRKAPPICLQRPPCRPMQCPTPSPVTSRACKPCWTTGNPGNPVKRPISTVPMAATLTTGSILILLGTDCSWNLIFTLPCPLWWR